MESLKKALKAKADECRDLRDRCATLFAAGQVLSTHVDRCDSHMWVDAGSDGARACTRCPAIRYPCSSTCTHDDAAKPGHPERVKEKSEAFHDVSVQLDDDSERKMMRLLRDAREQGSEAMRAACWEAVQAIMQKYGLSDASQMREEMKSAIEGAVP